MARKQTACTSVASWTRSLFGGTVLKISATLQYIFHSQAWDLNSVACCPHTVNYYTGNKWPCVIPRQCASWCGLEESAASNAPIASWIGTTSLFVVIINTEPFCVQPRGWPTHTTKWRRIIWPRQKCQEQKPLCLHHETHIMVSKRINEQENNEHLKHTYYT